MPKIKDVHIVMGLLKVIGVRMYGRTYVRTVTRRPKFVRSMVYQFKVWASALALSARELRNITVFTVSHVCLLLTFTGSMGQRYFAFGPFKQTQTRKLFYMVCRIIPTI